MTDLNPDIIQQARAALIAHGLADNDGDDYVLDGVYATGAVTVILEAVAPLIAAQALEELRDYLAEDRRVWHGDRGVQVATDTSDPRTMIPLGEFLSARAAELRGAGQVSAAPKKHTYRKDIDYTPDGTAWSWTVAECECDQPWRHA